MTRYWIDTDPGLDDAIAILLALRQVGADLVGLSTVQGNVEEAEAARNLARVLGTLDDESLLPEDWQPVLARGAEAALANGPVYRGYAYHGSDGLGNLPWRPARRWEPRLLPAAASALVDAVRRWGDDLHLVCIGPLTNLATAVRLEPRLPSMLRQVTIMGGSLRAGGNETLAAEFNFLADAEAARDVLAAGFAQVRLVTLDGCLETRLFPPDLAALQALGTPAARVAAELLEPYGRRITGPRGVPMYDPTAWLGATLPDLLRWEALYVVVDTGRDVAHGATLADWRGRTELEPNVRVAMGVADRAAYLEALLAILRRP